ncbi:MAG: hypothetical protein C4575_05645, partial [Desulforudis sp.]
EIVLNGALLRFRAISQLILAQNIFLSISRRRSLCKRLSIQSLCRIAPAAVKYFMHYAGFPHCKEQPGTIRAQRIYLITY